MVEMEEALVARANVIIGNMLPTIAGVSASRARIQIVKAMVAFARETGRDLHRELFLARDCVQDERACLVGSFTTNKNGEPDLDTLDPIAVPDLKRLDAQLARIDAALEVTTPYWGIVPIEDVRSCDPTIAAAKAFV